MNKIIEAVNKLLGENEGETVILHVMDWNARDRYYKAPVKLVLEFARRMLKDGKETTWDWWWKNVQQGEVKVGPNDETLDEYYFDFFDPKTSANEMLTAYDEYKESNA